ncbi:MAG: hypothetical protein NXY57DRAFT_775785 [Lentinula lateritia]|nr:MAG: hypothetical protein NXY57DRAFT_775785 [Lentinula lateritia]
MVSPTPKISPAPKAPYHHAIPRFILRRFAHGPKKSKAQRNKEFRQTGVDPNYIWFYDIATGALTSQSVGSIYGVPDLYADSRAVNPQELEKKFSFLERDAAKIIETIHTAEVANSSSRQVTMKREDLETLRKFLFLQHYRAARMSISYFDEGHPENAPVRDWIVKYKDTHHLNSSNDLWLHVLRYYLDTPAYLIQKHALDMYDKYGGFIEVHLMMQHRVDPNMEHYPALAYQNQAGMYFLCIWEAADGDEFILSNDGFGLWEGSINGAPCAHRLFVISPRTAIVLRSNFLRPGLASTDSLIVHSDFADINPPVPISNPLDLSDLELKTRSDSLMASRTREDVFRLPVFKLSHKHTQAMNSVVFTNAHKDGSITFLSRECMSRTLQAHCTNFEYRQDECRYRSFLNVLGTLASVQSPQLQTIPPSVLTDIPEYVHEELYVLLMRITLGITASSSQYDTSVVVIETLSFKRTAFSVEHAQLASSAIENCCSRLHISQLSPTTSEKSFVLTRKLSTDKANALLDVMFAFLNMHRCPLDPIVDLQHCMAVVAVLQWSVKHGEAFEKIISFDNSPSGHLSTALKALRTQSLVESLQNLHPEDCLKQMVTHIAGGMIEYPSKYDRAYALYVQASKCSGDFFLDETKRLSSEVISRMKLILKPPHADFKPNSEAALVEHLSKNKTKILFIRLDQLFNTLGFPRTVSEGANTFESSILILIREVVYVEFLTWCAQNRHDTLDILFFAQGLRNMQDIRSLHLEDIIRQ